MRKVIILTVLSFLGLAWSNAQETITDNGKNLEDVCPTATCHYMYFDAPIYFPLKEDKEWEIRNLEIGIKPKGNFIVTGDLFVYGADTAVVLALDIGFYSKKDKLLYSHTINEFEFYNEPLSAEPIVSSGQMDESLVAMFNYVDVKINSSRRLPYYEISTDCYLACKELKLKESKKKFRKMK